MSAANRRRGANAERAVVTYLRAEGWPDTRRDLAGDGRQPGDIDWHPLICLEVKDRAASSWPTWCRQATAEARAGTHPVVVRRTRGVPDAGHWEARLPEAALDDLLAETNRLIVVSPATSLVDGAVWAHTSLDQIVAAVLGLDGRAA